MGERLVMYAFYFTHNIYSGVHSISIFLKVILIQFNFSMRFGHGKSDRRLIIRIP